MNMENEIIQLNELVQIEDDLTLLCTVIDWLRPEDASMIEGVEQKINQFATAMDAQPEQAALIRTRIQKFIINLRFLPLYSDTGILPRQRFASELRHRIYDKLLPAPPVVFSAKNLIDYVFSEPQDPQWVAALPDAAWMQLYHTFFPLGESNKVELHLQDEALYALEMLSIYLAAEEMEEELLRLDPSIADHDSNFVAQEREISDFIAAYRSQLHPTAESRAADSSHAHVMLQQCSEQVKKFRQLALHKGSDLRLTYLLERLEQILARINELLGILEAVDRAELETKSLALFRKLVAEQQKEHSVSSLLRQTSYLFAKSVTNHASETGEHYVTENRQQYLQMLGRGLGAGVFIALMALIKIGITSTNLSMGWATLWISLNYGLGFVIIHLFHFTVATKQPAMTAAYIAKQLEHANNGMANEQDLARLIVNVGRSQFVAIGGNVLAALPVALLIGFSVSALTGNGIMKDDKAVELMAGQNPFTSPALFYAAIAGVWLFVSGLVAGYYDNRSAYLELPARIRSHPLVKRMLSPAQRDGLANYLGANFGALVGNFFFGVMLGVTGYVGYLLHLPLDIRHVAFSVSNVGYAVTVLQPGLWIVAEFVVFALMIGVVNLTVSFALALYVAMRSRRIRLGSIRDIAGAYWQEVRQQPRAVILPPATEPDVPQQAQP
jgi:site-specific recombinase